MPAPLSVSLTVLSVSLTAPPVSSATESIFLLGFLKVFFPFCLDLFCIFIVEALESNIACLIKTLLLCLQISDLRWLPEVDSRHCSLTHSDAFSKMEVYRVVAPVFISTPLSGSMVISDDLGLVCCFAALRILVNLCWRLLCLILLGLADFGAFLWRFASYGSDFGHRNKFSMLWQLRDLQQRIGGGCSSILLYCQL